MVNKSVHYELDFVLACLISYSVHYKQKFETIYLRIITNKNHNFKREKQILTKCLIYATDMYMLSVRTLLTICGVIQLANSSIFMLCKFVFNKMFNIHVMLI